MWVRGLKPAVGSCTLWAVSSHPMWVRGLKHLKIDHAPTQLRVAPYVGAWIETRRDCSCRNPRMSHPMWVRGLKLF